MTTDEREALLLIDETCDDMGCECCALWSAHNGQMRAALREAWAERDAYRALRDREHDRRVCWERQCLDREAERDEARAEVERLSGECIHKRHNDQAQEDLENAQLERDEARAEVERLRESRDYFRHLGERRAAALDRVRALCDDEVTGSTIDYTAVAVADVRAALDGEA